MAYKAIFAFCLLAVFTQMTFGQCQLGSGSLAPYRFAASLPNLGSLDCANPGFGAPGYGPGLAYGSGVGYGSSNNGGGFTVTSTSTTAPSGITLTSDNTIQGNVVITGELPLYGTAALEGNTSSSGVGIANYGCGNGVSAIESVAGSGVRAAGAYSAGLSGISGLSSLSGGHGHLGQCGCIDHI